MRAVVASSSSRGGVAVVAGPRRPPGRSTLRCLAYTGGQQHQRRYQQQTYNNFTDDAGEALQKGWGELRAYLRDEWPPEARANAAKVAAGATAVVWLGGALTDAVERLPLVPGALKLAGLSFSLWFFWRYLLFASGREELARVSLSELLTPLGQDQRRDDAAGFNAEVARRGSGGGGSHLSSGAGGGYGGGDLRNAVHSALEEGADSGGSGGNKQQQQQQQQQGGGGGSGLGEGDVGMSAGEEVGRGRM